MDSDSEYERLYESFQQLRDWQLILKRGRSRVLRSKKDPDARAKFLADNPPPKQAVVRRPEDDVRWALRLLPAYCTPSATPCSSPRDSHHSFLTSFPAEIRNMIYQYAVNYPSCRSMYDAYYSQAKRAKCRPVSRVCHEDCSCAKNPVGILEHRAPTILLLSKQITREALTVLYLRTFTIDRIPPWIMGEMHPRPITDFISEGTLQSIRFVEIKVSLGDSHHAKSGQVWLRILKDVLVAWSKKNSLVRIKVMFKVSNVNHRAVWYSELKDYDTLKKQIYNFVFKHGHRLSMLDYEHWVLDHGYAYRTGFRNPLIRKHPDPNIWQGSVLEWI
ncbi:Uu.00g016230.m01.CDS01 [Anthostomella pinea]|uniref:Uu.00g016230.m01.CDS01 n=1 Tax=Anthostomella pinea TaxID=933095 RepID=A0AAI8YQD9_9PEZI|nr:Uu.00g016230.m01.CDS01 [Anthostomella pinea]